MLNNLQMRWAIIVVALTFSLYFIFPSIRFFVFENVPGMLSAIPGDKKVTERIFEAFADIGYTIKKPEEMKSIIYC